eukprot:tig00020684_g12900.t1
MAFKGGQLLHNDMQRRLVKVQSSSAPPPQSPFAAGPIMAGALDAVSARTGGSGESLSAASNFSVSTFGTAVEFVPGPLRRSVAESVELTKAMQNRGLEVRGLNTGNLKALANGTYVTKKAGAGTAGAGAGAGAGPPARASQPQEGGGGRRRQVAEPLPEQAGQPAGQRAAAALATAAGVGGGVGGGAAAVGASRASGLSGLSGVSGQGAGAGRHHPASRVRSFSEGIAGPDGDAGDGFGGGAAHGGGGDDFDG